MGSTPPLTHGTSMGHTPMEYLAMGVTQGGWDFSLLFYFPCD